MIVPIQVILLLPILAASTWTDINYHRIPNALSLGGVALAIALHTWMAGTSGLLTGIGGTAVAMGIFLPFYLLRGMSAGDVKLMGTVGAFLGPHNTMLAAGLSLGAGGILAILILLARGGFGDMARRYWATFKCLFSTLKVIHQPPAAGEVAAIKFPYAAAIGIGTLAALWWLDMLQDTAGFLLSTIR